MKAAFAALLVSPLALAQSYPTGYGPNPALPEPERSLIPTVNVAPVDAWQGQDRPRTAPGFTVTAYARDLDHPRWVYTLPNGDVGGRDQRPAQAGRQQGHQGRDHEA